MPSAFVTGATGQDGSYLCESLVADGWQVHALVRTQDVNENPLPDAVVRHIGDLRDIEGLHSVLVRTAPNFVFNLGGISSIEASWSSPDLTAIAVGAGLATILATALEIQEREGRDVRVVQASSSQIFGVAAESPQNELTPIRPASPYAAAKAFAQDLVRMYRDRDLFAASAIFFNHESPRRPTSFVTRKITSGVAAISAGRADRLTLGDLSARRDWGWAPDYVEAMRAIATAPTPTDYVVATGQAHSVREFVAASFKVAGIEDWEPYVESSRSTGRHGDAHEMLGDPTRIQETLGWRPTVGFDEIVEKMTRHDLQIVSGSHAEGPT